MKFLLVLFSALFFVNLSGQKQADTLFLCRYKVAMKREKVVFNCAENSTIYLPIEFGLTSYTNKTRKKIIRNFASHLVDCDETGSTIGTKTVYDSIYLTDSMSSIYLNNHIDTLTINKTKDLSTVPFIKSGKLKYPFVYLHFYLVKNNHYTEVTVSCLNDWSFAGLFDSFFQNEPAFKDFDYILIFESAYRKKEATYLLDQQFVLKIKK